MCWASERALGCVAGDPNASEPARRKVVYIVGELYGQASLMTQWRFIIFIDELKGSHLNSYF